MKRASPCPSTSAIQHTGRASRPTPPTGKQYRGTAPPTNSMSTPTTSTLTSATPTSCFLPAQPDCLDEAASHTGGCASACGMRLPSSRLGDPYSHQRPHSICADLPVEGPGLPHGDSVHRGGRSRTEHAHSLSRTHQCEPRGHSN